MKTAGAPCTAAKLIPAYQSPSLVAPSPKVQTATWPVRRSFMLMAAPAAGGRGGDGARHGEEVEGLGAGVLGHLAALVGVGLGGEHLAEELLEGDP